ncbi:MAG: hypothetical protein LBL08_03520 [Candidatus Nomurabacteria bacterium]|jgi:hypothetical protein|nr:hypothetical protein [Candidatus Nomurabacteria bacterium]
MGGSLSDQQLKEFDEYLSGVGPDKSEPEAAPKPVEEEKPEPKPMPAPEKQPVKSSGNADYIDEIIDLHQKKVDGILDLLSKIDAKTHKDIVADLVEEMQYQNSVLDREKSQAGDLKQLFQLAKEARK